MNILITTLSYQKLTGSELYIYELARELTLLGHKVLISAMNTEPSLLVSKTPCPVCKMGQEPDFKPDIIHCNQKETIEAVLRSKTKIPIVATVHSEIMKAHEGVITGQNITYISVRTSITNMCKESGVKVVEIPNPIDMSRFKSLPQVKNNKILFAGTYYVLREQAVLDVIDNYDSGYFVGDYFVDLGKAIVSDLKGKHFYFLPSRWDIETLLKDCQFTAGINMGRTAIEGMASGRPNLNYTVDEQGKILNKEMVNNDVSAYDSKLVVKKILKVYEKSLTVRKNVSKGQ